jgi:hypothetical protein
LDAAAKYWFSVNCEPNLNRTYYALAYRDHLRFFPTILLTPGKGIARKIINCISTKATLSHGTFHSRDSGEIWNLGEKAAFPSLDLEYDAIEGLLTSSFQHFQISQCLFPLLYAEAFRAHSFM